MRCIIAKIITTYHDVDIHIKNLKYMYKKDMYVPIYYQMALIQGLSSAQAGLVLYFFTEASKIGVEFVHQYFGSPIHFVEPERVDIEVNRVTELEKLL